MVSKFTGWENISHIESQRYNNIREILKQAYENGLRIPEDQIEAINKELSQIPNLVINFDETLTQESTIDGIIEEICSAMPKDAEKLIDKRKQWQIVIKDRKVKSAVKAFYEEVIDGIDAQILNMAYDNVVAQTKLNPNLNKVFEYIRKVQNITAIPLFILSLNNYELIEKFYSKYKEYFKSQGVAVIGIMANQVKLDSDGRIDGVIEHVKNGNKHKFIPDHAIMLVDSRETKDLLERGVNVLNIQGEKYNEIFLDASFEIIAIIRTIKRYQKDSFPLGLFEEAHQIFNDYMILKFGWESLKLHDTIAEERILSDVDALLQKIKNFVIILAKEGSL